MWHVTSHSTAKMLAHLLCDERACMMVHDGKITRSALCGKKAKVVVDASRVFIGWVLDTSDN